ncbi:hypothetical protein ABZP36_023873 [Zizania latifolia]
MGHGAPCHVRMAEERHAAPHLRGIGRRRCHIAPVLAATVQSAALACGRGNRSGGPVAEFAGLDRWGEERTGRGKWSYSPGRRRRGQGGESGR